MGSDLRFSPSPTFAGDTPVQGSGQSHGKGALAHAHVRAHIHTYARMHTYTHKLGMTRGGASGRAQ